MPKTTSKKSTSKKPQPVSIPVALAKIHRATVTKAHLDYVGSITIDKDLLDASGLIAYQKVHINNVRNGAHWETYVLEGPAGGADICLNGPPAHHFQPGDIVIIVAYGQMTPSDAARHVPTVVFVDEKNRITGIKAHRDIPLGATSVKDDKAPKKSKK